MNWAPTMTRYSHTASATEWTKDRNVRALTERAIAGGLLLGGLLGQAGAEGIYTCIDAQGRRLTADRPIAACIDREQKVLSESGIVKRRIGPSLTAQELAAEEERARKEAEERNRVADEKRRNRALITRYPNRAAHDKERLAAIVLADEAIAAARKGTDELTAARKRLDAELEFYANDVSRVPPKLKRQIQENEQHMEAQQRFVANQETEKKRINGQFDEELARLQSLWGKSAAPATAAVPGATKR
jgi:hypothetical protein